MATNWDSIRTEYVAGVSSIKSLSTMYKVSENALEKRAGREKWAEARRRMSEQVTTSADAKIIETKVDSLAEFNASDLRIAQALRDQIALHIREAQTRSAPMDANQIRTLP